MADVVQNGVSQDGRSYVSERGQLILVAGLTIAVILVALVLLLNTVIYTENLATRGVDIGGGSAIEYRAVIIGGIGDLIDAENAQGGTFDEKDALLRSGITATDEVVGAQYLKRGVIAEINTSSITTEEGLLVVQNESRLFTSDTDNASWTVTTDTSTTRQFTIDLENVSTGTESSAFDGFTVTVSNGGNLWNVSVYEDDATGNLSVATGDTDPVERCSVNASTARLDVTAATLNGSPCDFQWADGVDQPYTIVFHQGDMAEGTYAFTAIGEPGTLNDTAGNSPFSLEAVYSATMEIRYESSELRFVTQVRVAPGEPDG